MANVNGAPLSRRTSFFLFSPSSSIHRRECFSERIFVPNSNRIQWKIVRLYIILRNRMFMQIEIPLNVTYTLFLFFYSVARRLRIIVMVIFSPFFFLIERILGEIKRGEEEQVSSTLNRINLRGRGKKKSKNRCANTRRKILYRFRCKDELSSDEVIL